MFVSLQLMGVLSASTDGEALPGHPGIGRVEFNFGPIWQGELEAVTSEPVTIDVNREVAPRLARAIGCLGTIGLEVDAGKLDLIKLASTVGGASISGEITEEILAALGDAGFDVPAPVVPQIKH